MTGENSGFWRQDCYVNLFIKAAPFIVIREGEPRHFLLDKEVRKNDGSFSMTNPEKQEKEEKKGFLRRLMDKMDQKLKSASEKKSCCCSSNSDKEKNSSCC